MESETKRRVRSKNFSLAEQEILTEGVAAQFDVITAKHCSSETGITKKIQEKAWNEILERVNAVGVAQRTVNEIKEKWRNLTKKAKADTTAAKKSAHLTGGGPPAPPLDPLIADVADLFRNSPSFHGIPGAGDCETDLFDFDILPSPEIDRSTSSKAPDVLEPTLSCRTKAWTLRLDGEGEQSTKPTPSTSASVTQNSVKVPEKPNRQKPKSLHDHQTEFFAEAAENQRLKRKLIHENLSLVEETKKATALFSSAMELFIKKMKEE